MQIGDVGLFESPISEMFVRVNSYAYVLEVLVCEICNTRRLADAVQRRRPGTGVKSTLRHSRNDT